MAHRRHARRAVGLGLIGDGIRRLRRARFFLLRELLADYGAWYMILLGVLAVVTMMRYPQGLWGLLAERWDLHVFPVRRGVRLSGPDAAASP